MSKFDHAHLHTDLLAPFDPLLIGTLQGRQKYLIGLLEQGGNTPTLKKQYISDLFEFALTTIDEWDPSTRWTDTSVCMVDKRASKYSPETSWQQLWLDIWSPTCTGWSSKGLRLRWLDQSNCHSFWYAHA